MLHTKKITYEEIEYDSVGKCLDCDAPVIFKGMKVCNIDDQLKGNQPKQPYGECVNCSTWFIIKKNDGYY